jgi:hypothetical protein
VRLVTPAVIAFDQAISSPMSEGDCYDLKSAPTANNKKTNVSNETEQQTDIVSIKAMMQKVGDIHTAPSEAYAR